ncbi:MAG: twin-arginine translocase TatA/TatE family subunit [Crocinitomicaceae bacterium]|nr:twin-arginine translocase TatA/TatE family subunit [Crocinitomicaceae bacterium]|tara:strand:- start:8434 stop:8637 length:204 start_codon:yes stop_codon:yes gene_type:complete
MNSIFLIGLPGGPEWIIIVIIVLLLFGGRKIPQLMKGLGEGIKEFKNASKEGEGKKKVEEENKKSND